MAVVLQTLVNLRVFREVASSFVARPGRDGVRPYKGRNSDPSFVSRLRALSSVFERMSVGSILLDPASVVAMGCSGRIEAHGLSYCDPWEEFGRIFPDCEADPATWVFPGLFRCEQITLSPDERSQTQWLWLMTHVAGVSTTVEEVIEALVICDEGEHTGFELPDVVAIDLNRLSMNGDSVVHRTVIDFVSLEIDLGGAIAFDRFADLFKIFAVWFNCGDNHWFCAQRRAGLWWICNDGAIGAPQSDADSLVRLATMGALICGMWLVRSGREGAVFLS
jgi:hypothetical protein